MSIEFSRRSARPDSPRARPTRRSLMASTGVLPLLLAGCGADPRVSEDPHELAMWYWNRGASPQLIEQLAEQIPGTDKHLLADMIGTTFDTKLRTSLAGNAYIPDITYINSNNALYFTNEDLFLDLSELGADSVKEDYYEWKWNLGMTPKGRFCFFPVDIGPTGFFYRQDLFEEVGLPSSPEDVAAATSTWEDWIALGAELKSATGSFFVNDAQSIYLAVLDSSPERYFDKNDAPLYLQPNSTVRHAWNLAVAAIEAGITARIPGELETDRNAAWSSGLTAGNLGAAWSTQILEESAPGTAGKWRIASQPVRAGNNGGAFIALPYTCKDPEAAMRLITWITSPESQAVAYEDVQLFPSTPESFEQLTYEGDFYGDQDPLEFFSTAAETVPTSFISALETSISGAFSRELLNVETGGKDPELAWSHTLAQAEKVLAKRGVEV